MNIKKKVTCSIHVLRLQVGVYLGKRDFVDRVDCVDPLGELDRFLMSLFQNKCLMTNSKTSVAACVLRQCSPLDGVIIVDPEALQGRKGNLQRVLM